jgi:hypothetical protein|nr:MAG TPA: hypothetical protein [Caudoviricetes sp.]
MSSACTQDRINHQEMKDFQRARMLLTSHFNAQAVKVQKFIPREKGCSVDALIEIEYKHKKRTLNLEIKERQKNDNLMRLYPFAELKVEKLNLMRLENKKNHGDLKYLSLYTDPTNGDLECAFYFDLSNILNDNFPMCNFKGIYKKENGYQQPSDVNLKFDNQGIPFVEKGDVRFQTDYHYTYMKMKDTQFDDNSRVNEKLILNMPLKYAKIVYLNPKYKEKYRFLLGKTEKVKYNYIVRTTQCHS